MVSEGASRPRQRVKPKSNLLDLGSIPSASTKMFGPFYEGVVLIYLSVAGVSFNSRIPGC